ncbi:ARI5A protein, partial [Prunella fulvescens]|nr:ARI5A protein [Prunella fulvescens]
MSPLAKKKLLAQVSKAESLPCPKRHCPEGRRAPSDTGPEPPALPGPGPAEQRSPEPAAAPDRAPSAAGPARSASPAGRDSQGCPQERGAAPAVFTGYFHAYRSEGPQPGACPPLWGYFSNLKDFLEPPSTFPARPEEPEQPPELRGQAGRPWEGRAAAVQACWVAPGATFGPAAPRAGHGRHEEEEDDDDEEEEDEEPFGLTVTSRAVSPLAKEGRDRRSRSPGGHQVLAKPKAVVATPGFAAPLPPDAFKGSALHFPGAFGSPLEHLKTPGVPAAPALSASPLVIPAFPSPLVVASELCRPLATGAGRLPASFGSSPRPRLYPAGPWHGQRSRSSPHVPAFPHHGRP